MSEWRVPLSDLAYDNREEEAAARVIGSRWLSMGPEVAAFEAEFAAFLGVRHAFAVSSGTAALHLALLSTGIGPGDEVIQPAVNFVATANMTRLVRAEPVFADIVALTDPTIAPAHVESLLTPRSRALVVMHYGGHLCRMGELAALCQERDLVLIEDAPHALGARYLDPTRGPLDGRHAGTLGDVGCFSFFSNKNLATGEGGMIVTDRDDLAERIRLLRSHGMTTLTWDRHQGRAHSYDVVANGFNYRFDEMRAAIGRVQLEKLPAGNARRESLVREYWESLAGLPGLILPFHGRPGESAHHIMVAVAPSAVERRTIVEHLSTCRIQTSLHYPCIADFSHFAENGAHGLTLSREFSSRTITLPLYPDLPQQALRTVCEEVAAALERVS